MEKSQLESPKCILEIGQLNTNTVCPWKLGPFDIVTNRGTEMLDYWYKSHKFIVIDENGNWKTC